MELSFKCWGRTVFSGNGGVLYRVPRRVRLRRWERENKNILRLKVSKIKRYFYSLYYMHNVSVLPTDCPKIIHVFLFVQPF